MISLFGKDSSNTVSYDYSKISYTAQQVQSRIDQAGYTKIILSPDYKNKPQLQINSTDYYASAIYVLSRPIHNDIKTATGEFIIENTSIMKADKVYVCAMLVTSPKGVRTAVDSLLQGVRDVNLNSVFGGSGILYHNDSILLLTQAIPIVTNLRKFEELLTGDVVVGSEFEFPAFKSDYHKVAFSFGIDEKGTLVEGLDFSSTGSIDSGNLNAGFGTFGNSIKSSSQQFNEAGESYIWNPGNTGGDTTTMTPVDDASIYVDCSPIYTNNSDVTTMVVPYGSAVSDNVSTMFMTGTFQMFYTTLVAFVIMLMTPLLYKMYFSVAMRHGSSENVQLGNKITYSTNLYFMFYAGICIFGLMLDSARKTDMVNGQPHTTEMGFAMMFVVFTFASYMCTFLIRSIGLDDNLYGNLDTQYKYSELFTIYWGFMMENYDFYYSFLGPVFLLLICFFIAFFVVRNKNPNKENPVGPMFALFFLGFLGILSTMGTFMAKSYVLSQTDVIV